MTADRQVLLRGWPGLDGWRRPPSSTPATYPSLAAYPSALYLIGAARAGTMPETFGLGAAVVARGTAPLTGTLVVPDDADQATRDGLAAWGAAHPLATLAGPRAWHVATLSEFFDPFATVERSPWAFTPTAYTGRGLVVGADLGRTFGLVAEHVIARTGRHRDGWSVWLPGWGQRHPDGGVKRKSPHRPCMNVQARRVGWQLDFGPVPAGAGKRHQGALWRGAFLDSLSLSYALDADRGANFAEHCAAFGIDADELPVAVTVDADGAAQLVATLDDVRELAEVLDDEAGRWLSSPVERREGRRRIDLPRTSSPGALAGQVLRRFGVRPPLLTLDLTDDEHQAWAEAFHGGLCNLDPRFAGVPFDAATPDLRSAYPMSAHLLAGWDLVTAEHVEREDVTDDLRDLCRRAAADPTVVLDPAVWQRFGFTRATVEPDGEPFVVAVDDPLRPDGRTELAAVHAEGRALSYSWPDVVAAAILSARVPHIVQATRLVPQGHQAGLRRRVPLLPGVGLRADDDPVVAMILARLRAKAAGDRRTAAVLRVVANALVYGIESRFDEAWTRTRRHEHGTDWTRTERPGPWSCLPVASTVAAGPRLLLAVLDRQVRDLGGCVAYCDTDSSVVPASPDGGTLTLPDGSTVRELAFAELDAILATFAPLSPAPAWNVWDPGHGDEPQRFVAFGPKRHVQRTGTGPVDATESQLGANYVDPPGMRGRGADGLRRWSSAAVERAIERAEAGKAWAWRPVPWEGADDLPFPAVRPFSVRTPAMARMLPVSFGARPGTAFLRADLHWRNAGVVPVVLDPGGLGDDWQALAWVDQATGVPLRLTTDLAEVDAVPVASLAVKADDWLRASRLEPIERVGVTPANVAHRGRVSGVLDADDAGLPGDLADHRPAYGTCAGCGCQLDHGTYCSDECRAVRRRGRRAVPRPPCALDGCELPARPRSRTCSEAHKKALARRPVLSPDAVYCPGDHETPVELVGLAAKRGTCRRCHDQGVAA